MDLFDHITDKYNKKDATELRLTRAKLDTPWNPSEPIEALWTRLMKLKRFSVGTSEEIHDDAIIEHTLIMFEASGLLSQAVYSWKMPIPTSTYAEFQTHFEHANKMRLQTLTASQVGFQTALLAQQQARLITQQQAALIAQQQPSPTIPPRNLSGDKQVFYCWSHGMSKNPFHTSQLCRTRKQGHKDDATLFNIKGGHNPFGLPSNHT